MDGQDTSIDSASNYSVGLDLYRRSEYHQAIAQLGPIIGQDGVAGKVARFYFGLSHRCLGIEGLAGGDYACAERHIRSAIGALGEQADLAKYLASVYANTRRFDQCARQVQRLGDKEPSVENARNFAQVLWRAGRREEAYMSLHAALRRFGPSAELNLQLGLFHAATDELDKAQEHLAKASELDPTSADAHYYLGLISAARASLAPAVRLFQRAFELRGSDLTLAYQLAVAAKAADQNGIHIVLRPIEHTPFAQSEEDSSQVRQLANYLTYEPDFIEAFLALPKSEMDQDLFGTLVDVTQLALAVHPNYADLHLHCCRMLQRMGQDQPALKHARQAVAINPRYAQACVQIGKICARLGRDKEAIKAVESAIRCGADWPDVHLLAGQLEAKRRRPDQAKSHLRRALQLNANYDPAAKALVALAA